MVKHSRKFSRKTDQRKALIKSVIAALFVKEKIKTTKSKAKEVSSVGEKLITVAKKGDVNAKRYLSKFLTPEITKKLVNEIAPRYKERKGGYTRIFKLNPRKSDGAEMAIVELVK